MSIISADAATALMNGRTFHRSNTMVNDDSGCFTLYLFGNAIARVTSDGYLEVTNAGYNTTTTNARLRALLLEYQGGYAISLTVKDGTPYFKYGYGHLSKVDSLIEFDNVYYPEWYSKSPKWTRVSDVHKEFMRRVEDFK